jgi:hypothetical protein
VSPLLAGDNDAILVGQLMPTTTTFAARLSAFERRLQNVLDRVPNPKRAPRVAATLRLALDDLATLLPPAEKRLLDHLRARRPLSALDGRAGFKTVSRRNERLQRLLSRVTAYCGSCTRYDLMQPYDRPGHRHRSRRGPRRRMLSQDCFPSICVWVPRWFLAEDKTHKVTDGPLRPTRNA